MTQGWGRKHGETYQALRRTVGLRVKQAMSEQNSDLLSLAKELCHSLGFSKPSGAYIFISRVRAGRAYSTSWLPYKSSKNQSSFAGSLEHNERELKRLSTLLSYLMVSDEDQAVLELKRTYPNFRMSQRALDFQI
jgi:hypothetical protein